MTLPSLLRIAIGLTEGDLVEASVQRGKIALTAKLVIDRSKFPNADEMIACMKDTLKQRASAQTTAKRAR